MIRVIEPGMFTTVQDLGRWGYQAYGMPVAGAMDRFAHRVANLLVGNLPAAATLEMTLLGGRFVFTEDTAVALTGADMGATLDGRPVSPWQSFMVTAGSELAFRNARIGCRTYLAVRGGIDVPVVLGSRATYTRARIGGLEGRALKAGDQLNAGSLFAAPVCGAMLPREYVPVYGSEVTLRVLLGPQDDHFTPEGIATLFTATFTVTTDADRMGYRLAGPKISHATKPDIISDALGPGAIQVPGHGNPIIMMADRQTTGGYAKIGAVIGPDLTRLAQAKPGDMVRFHRVTLVEAHAAYRAEQVMYHDLARWYRKLGVRTPERRFAIRVGSELFLVDVEEMK